jgi:hypothetical protein
VYDPSYVPSSLVNLLLLLGGIATAPYMYDTGIDEDRECQDSKEHPYGYFSFTLTSFPFDTVGSYKLRFALRDGTREVLTKDL